ncbi:MAG: hypothetical protein U9Q77_08640 [Candidatus Marinimicrobia bacterium]|nr:hypothetical protein [Candidatus Neomarinimicrobiota bacterium]
MLAIHISHDTLKYAQLVNFKGIPFIESLGQVSIKEGLQIPDTTNAEVIRSLADQISDIRNSAEFPDNSTHIVIDNDWFPLLVHEVDSVLSGADQDKYLKWRVSEMLENAVSQYTFVHQEMNTGGATAVQFLSVGIPQSFDNWLEKVIAPSELKVKNVILDIQAIGDLLTASGQFDPEGGIQVVMNNREDAISCYIYKGLEFSGLFQASLNWDYKITMDHVRGDLQLITQVKTAIEKAIMGKHDPENIITNLFYFNSTGDPAALSNLSKYQNSCKTLDLAHHFNFRDPEFDNIDEYAIVLGALSSEIQERFSED